MESIAELNARGQRYNNLSGTLYMVAILALIILAVYLITSGQFIAGVATVAIGLLFLTSVVIEVRGDRAFEKADALSAAHNPAEPLKGVQE